MTDEQIAELIKIMENNNDVLNCSELEMKERVDMAADFLKGLNNDK